MGKYLVSGVSGTGKTTLMAALAERGHHAFSTDEVSGVTRFEDRQTGERYIPPAGSAIDFDTYGWNWQPQALKGLLDRYPTVILGGVTSNQSDFYDWFDKLFVLTIDEATLRRRILERDTNDFGKHPDDFAHILRSHQEIERDMRAHGAIAIDSTLPINEVVAQIEAHLAD